MGVLVSGEKGAASRAARLEVEESVALARGELPLQAHATRRPLSPRELEVARLIADGYSTLNIAAHLDVGEETVRTLLKRVYQKWRIASRVELTRLLLSS